MKTLLLRLMLDPIVPCPYWEVSAHDTKRIQDGEEVGEDGKEAGETGEETGEA